MISSLCFKEDSDRRHPENDRHIQLWAQSGVEDTILVVRVTWVPQAITVYVRLTEYIRLQCMQVHWGSY
jgi:hypothetical protein